MACCHPHQTLEVRHVCCQLRQLGLKVRELARLLRGDAADARRAGPGIVRHLQKALEVLVTFVRLFESRSVMCAVLQVGFVFVVKQKCGARGRDSRGETVLANGALPPKLLHFFRLIPLCNKQSSVINPARAASPTNSTQLQASWLQHRRKLFADGS